MRVHEAIIVGNSQDEDYQFLFDRRKEFLQDKIEYTRLWLQAVGMRKVAVTGDFKLVGEQLEFEGYLDFTPDKEVPSEDEIKKGNEIIKVIGPYSFHTI